MISDPEHILFWGKIFRPTAYLAVVGLAVYSLFYQPPPPQYSKIQGEAQGTTFSLTFRSTEASHIETSIETLLRSIDLSMSLWVENSEIRRFNRHKSLVPFAITSDLATIVSEAWRIHSLTKGAFDITVGPLTALYGFGPNKKTTPPADAEIQAVLPFVGMDKLKITSSHLQKMHPDLCLDLNGIAQGYTVDRLANLLENNRINDYMVEVGGEIRVKGLNPSGQKWRIAINSPKEGAAADEFFGVLELTNTALSTSGNYRSFYRHNDKTYGHILDPSNGRTVQKEVFGATVVYPTCTGADALSTAAMVMGLEKAMEILGRDQAGLYLIVAKEGKLEARTNKQLDVLLSKTQP